MRYDATEYAAKKWSRWPQPGGSVRCYPKSRACRRERQVQTDRRFVPWRLFTDMRDARACRATGYVSAAVFRSGSRSLAASACFNSCIALSDDSVLFALSIRPRSFRIARSLSLMAQRRTKTWASWNEPIRMGVTRSGRLASNSRAIRTSPMKPPAELTGSASMTGRSTAATRAATGPSKTTASTM